LSLVLHLAGLLLLVLVPTLWSAIVVLIILDHLFLTFLGLWPRSQLLGENLTRLPDTQAEEGAVALTFDDGPDATVTPQVLECLDRHGVKASFFCIGERAHAHPELVREIARRGHSVENHSYRHPYTFAFFGPWRLRREIEAAQDVLTALAGTRPRFFRAPAGLRNPFLDYAVQRLGMRYISWTRRGYDAVQTDPEKVLKRLLRNLAAGDVLLLHDGTPARTAAGEPVVLMVLPRLLQGIREQGLHPVSLPIAFTNDPKRQPIETRAHQVQA
jgi:peptidoglycan/xylan/chitin deacetylase (PgdA/CDA1 family)